MVGLIDTVKAAELLGVRPNQLEQWRCRGLGPNWVRVGPKLVRYRPEDIQEFIRRNLSRPGAEDGVR